MALTRERFETLEGSGYHGVRQLSVFMENRIGQILRMSQIIEQKDVKILGLSVIDSVDCSIVRLIFDQPDEAYDLLRQAGFAVSVTEVVVVGLPAGKRGLIGVFTSLLSCEINIAYTYPLLASTVGPAIVMSVDNLEMATDILQRKKFRVFSESDLNLGL